MKKTILLFVFCLSARYACQAQGNAPKEPNIRQFWMVVLKTGPQDKLITDSVQRSLLFKGHFSNMEKLYNEGFLKAAGPFGKNDLSWRGLFIFDCKNREEAESLVKSDPAVSAGIFIYDLVPWYSEPSGSFQPGKPAPKLKPE